MSIRSVTDSTCDLAAALLDSFEIIVVPLHINLDGSALLKWYRDHTG